MKTYVFGFVSVKDTWYKICNSGHSGNLLMCLRSLSSSLALNLFQAPWTPFLQFHCTLQRPTLMIFMLSFPVWQMYFKAKHLYSYYLKVPWTWSENFKRGQYLIQNNCILKVQFQAVGDFPPAQDQRISFVLPNHPSGFTDLQNWPRSQPSSPKGILSFCRWQ